MFKFENLVAMEMNNLIQKSQFELSKIAKSGKKKCCNKCGESCKCDKDCPCRNNCSSDCSECYDMSKKSYAEMFQMILKTSEQFDSLGLEKEATLLLKSSGVLEDEVNSYANFDDNFAKTRSTRGIPDSPAFFSPNQDIEKFQEPSSEDRTKSRTSKPKDETLSFEEFKAEKAAEYRNQLFFVLSLPEKKQNLPTGSMLQKFLENTLTEEDWQKEYNKYLGKPTEKTEKTEKKLKKLSPKPKGTKKQKEMFSITPEEVKNLSAVQIIKLPLETLKTFPYVYLSLFRESDEYSDAMEKIKKQIQKDEDLGLKISESIEDIVKKFEVAEALSKTNVSVELEVKEKEKRHKQYAVYKEQNRNKEQLKQDFKNIIYTISKKNLSPSINEMEEKINPNLQQINKIINKYNQVLDRRNKSEHSISLKEKGYYPWQDPRVIRAVDEYVDMISPTVFLQGDEEEVKKEDKTVARPVDTAALENIVSNLRKTKKLPSEEANRLVNKINEYLKIPSDDLLKIINSVTDKEKNIIFNDKIESIDEKPLSTEESGGPKPEPSYKDIKRNIFYGGNISKPKIQNKLYYDLFESSQQFAHEIFEDFFANEEITLNNLISVKNKNKTFKGTAILGIKEFKTDPEIKKLYKIYNEYTPAEWYEKNSKEMMSLAAKVFGELIKNLNSENLVNLLSQVGEQRQFQKTMPVWLRQMFENALNTLLEPYHTSEAIIADMFTGISAEDFDPAQIQEEVRSYFPGSSEISWEQALRERQEKLKQTTPAGIAQVWNPEEEKAKKIKQVRGPEELKAPEEAEESASGSAPEPTKPTESTESDYERFRRMFGTSQETSSPSSSSKSVDELQKMLDEMNKDKKKSTANQNNTTYMIKNLENKINKLYSFYTL